MQRGIFTPIFLPDAKSVRDGVADMPLSEINAEIEKVRNGEA